ncbi:MAG: hypothetical protein CMH83_07525 [Nocardioides sp.]|nr:hypothetical protein [Nocardioides sp.]
MSDETRMLEDTLSLGEVARRNGVGVDALRLLAQDGVLPVAHGRVGHVRVPRAACPDPDEVRALLARRRAELAEEAAGQVARVRRGVDSLERLVESARSHPEDPPAVGDGLVHASVVLDDLVERLCAYDDALRRAGTPTAGG